MSFDDRFEISTQFDSSKTGFLFIQKYKLSISQINISLCSNWPQDVHYLHRGHSQNTFTVRGKGG